MNGGRPALLVFIGLLAVISLSAQPADRTAPAANRQEKDGITIEIRGLPEQVEGYRSFELKATNKTDGPRSVHGHIVLLTLRGEAAGECTVYFELKGQETKTRTKACKETALSRNFRFEILRVYPFILEGQEES